MTHLSLHGCFGLLMFAAVCSGGCARARPAPRELPRWVFESSQQTVKGKGNGMGNGKGMSTGRRPAMHIKKPRGGIRGRSEASDLVVAVLQDTGLHFGTDGSVAALWGYLRTSHTAVPPAQARTGDVLFFQTRAAGNPAGGGAAPACDSPDHVAIVDVVEGDGRIQFAEARDGEIRRSFVDPLYPDLRRDERGRVLNTFLRPKRVGDPEDSALLAGEMLCAAVRPVADVHGDVTGARDDDANAEGRVSARASTQRH